MMNSNSFTCHGLSAHVVSNANMPLFLRVLAAMTMFETTLLLSHMTIVGSETSTTESAKRDSHALDFFQCRFKGDEFTRVGTGFYS